MLLSHQQSASRNQPETHRSLDLVHTLLKETNVDNAKTVYKTYELRESHIQVGEENERRRGIRKFPKQ